VFVSAEVTIRFVSVSEVISYIYIYIYIYVQGMLIRGESLVQIGRQ